MDDVTLSNVLCLSIWLTFLSVIFLIIAVIESCWNALTKSRKGLPKTLVNVDLKDI
jgi:hypothetical protein